MRSLTFSTTLFLNRTAVLLILLGFIFFEDPGFLYQSSFVIVLLNGFQNMPLSVSSIKLYSGIFILLLPSLIGPFFDIKFSLNIIGFFLIGVFVSSGIVYANKSISVVWLFLFLNLFISGICLFYLLISSNYIFILNLDFNSAFARVFESLGVFKQTLGQLLACSVLYVLFEPRITKLLKFILLFLALPLLVGSRSVFFGLLCFFLIKLASPKLRLLFAATLLLAHYGFIVYIIKNPSFDLLFQFDPRWGMQALSIFTSHDFFFGVGYGGWDEYAIKEVGHLSKYIDYLPVWLGYSSTGYIPTTLESSLFQLNAEIGVVSTIILFVLLIKLSLDGFEDIDFYVKLFSSINFVIVLSSFYEDNLFQPYWFIVFFIYVGLYYKRKFKCLKY